MAPEILRYEKYDAKADLWSVGAVLYEMAVGKPPFRANNHVELLRKIEKGEDRIKFPDESRDRDKDKDGKPEEPPSLVSSDIKALIRSFLKRKPAERMGFEDFFACGVWDGYMTELEDSGTSSNDIGLSTEESSMGGSRIRHMVESVDRDRSRMEGSGTVSRRAPQPISTDPALNPHPAVVRPSEASRMARRSEPKYFVSEDLPPLESDLAPRPIADRRASRGSVEEPSLITPSSHPPLAPSRTTPDLDRRRLSNETRRSTHGGSPLASTPPVIAPHTTATERELAMAMIGRSESALEGSDSVVGREYVVVEKRTVEINALADGEWNCVYTASLTQQNSIRRRRKQQPWSGDRAREPV